MKCPIIVSRVHHDDGGDTAVPIDCLKADCALWLEDRNLCSIKDMALEMGYTQLRLGELNDRLKRGLPR